MSFWELVLAAIVLLFGVPAIRWNATSAALVASWAFGYAMFYVFGYRFSTPEMVYCDWFVIAIIAAKPEACFMRPYRGFWHQVSCMFLERSRWDRAVLVLFLAAWVAYSVPITAGQRWWGLWSIAVLQFAAAAGEAFTKWRRAKALPSEVPERHPSAGLEFARPAWGGGYG